MVVLTALILKTWPDKHFCVTTELTKQQNNTITGTYFYQICNMFDFSCELCRKTGESIFR
jgi:16S rRNA C1402 (ribose-2'-O) methylase RsmI